MTDSSKATVSLLPCPFCGAPEEELMIFADGEVPTAGPERRIQCSMCFVEAPFYDSEAEAIAAWNRRASPPAFDAMKEALEEFGEHAAERVADAPEWRDHDTVSIPVRIGSLRAVLAALRLASGEEQ